MNKRFFAILIEYAWIAMGIFCLVAGIYYSGKVGSSNAWLMYLLAIISFGMFVVRRMQRKNLEKKNRK